MFMFCMEEKKNEITMSTVGCMRGIVGSVFDRPAGIVFEASVRSSIVMHDGTEDNVKQ
jgi:hypothetical protein